MVKGNELLAEANIDADNVEDLVKVTAKVGGPLFNNGGQCYNHEFFWKSVSPNGGGKPTGAIAKEIDADFGRYDDLKKEFVNGGATQFSSGCWPVFGQFSPSSIFVIFYCYKAFSRNLF